MTFDPNAAASGDGVFGLPHAPDTAAVVLVPVPFEATTSYRGGTADGPRAILAASRQVDLFDRETGRPYEAGIAMLAESAAVRAWNGEASALARQVREERAAANGATPDLLARVNHLCGELNVALRSQVGALLERGKLVGTVGGDHGAVFGAIAAHAERFPGLGILHVDAHADLRPAYEGFTWSHASIMNNVTRNLPGVSRLVQVGIRDFGEDELEIVRASENRITIWFDADLARERFEGATWGQQVPRILEGLPEQVYVSFDIDGLDPALCPHTGTPVPGGLSFAEASYLLGALARSGRRIVGFDLVEVAPSPDGDEWDANVGARLLYKLVGWALASQGRRRGAATAARTSP
jgi:agmatinase